MSNKRSGTLKNQRDQQCSLSRCASYLPLSTQINLNSQSIRNTTTKQHISKWQRRKQCESHEHESFLLQSLSNTTPPSHLPTPSQQHLSHSTPFPASVRPKLLLNSPLHILQTNLTPPHPRLLLAPTCPLLTFISDNRHNKPPFP